MTSNDDSPEPPLGLPFGDCKEANTSDFHKLHETNPFAELISHLQDENIIPILRKCILALPASSDNEAEEADSSKDHTLVLNDLFEMVEKAKKNKLVTLKETSIKKENIPSTSNQTSDWRFDSLVAHSSSLSPNANILSLDRSSNFRSKRVSSSRFCHLSSRSPDSSRRRAPQTTLSSNSRSLASGSRVCSQSRRYCSSRRHKSYDSRSTSPEDTYHRKKEKDCHKRFRRHRNYDYYKRSPGDTAYYRKNKKNCLKSRKSRRSLFRERSSSRGSMEGDGALDNKRKVDPRKQFRSHRSWSSYSRSTYYKEKDDHLKYRKSRQVPHRERWSSKGSIDVEETTPKKRLKSDVSMTTCSNKFRNFSVDSEGERGLKLEEIKSLRRLLPDSDEESDVGMENVRRLSASSRIKSVEDPSNLILLESDDEREKVSDVKFSRDKMKDVKEKNEILDKKFNIPNNFFCDVCQLSLSSELTWGSHINGKNHAKQLRKLSVYEVSKGSLAVPVTPTIVSENVPRFANGPAYDQPGPSWRSFSLPSIKKEPNHGESENGASKDRWLDTSKGVFYCTLCDSHMNNLNMWEAHVRGKRHLSNDKKVPGENISKMKSERLHGATSILEAMIDEELIGEIVVGLDFVRETRASNGEMYNCFLCGACSTKIDILDHLLLLKHRTKYLEKLHADGFKNSIKEIDSLELKENSYRIALINRECIKMLKRYGRGKVEVYQSKN